MTQVSLEMRHAVLDARYATIGAAPTLVIRTGAAPITCAAPATGTLLWSLVLPSAWMAAASGGKREKLGTWSATGVETGTPGYFRIIQGGVCHLQGKVGFGPYDLQLPFPALITSGVIATVTSYYWEEPGA